jgi:hypothetical protein
MSSCEDCGRANVPLREVEFFRPDGTQDTATECDDCYPDCGLLMCRDCGHHFVARKMFGCLCAGCVGNHPDDCDCEGCEWDVPV